MRDFSLEGDEIPLDMLLQAREQRAALQRRFLAQYRSPLISLTLLAAGGVKKNALLDYVFERALAALDALFEELRIRPEARSVRPLKTGHEALFAVPVAAEALKSAVIKLEDFSPLSRLWDLDVIDTDGTPLSRSSLGFGPRPCLLCDDDAKVCARSRKHDITEIRREMQARAFADFIGEGAYRALITEARLTPKPGLVDQINNGSHHDMDLRTLERSAAALRPFFTGFTRLGMTLSALPGHEILPKLRLLGMAAEQAMFRVTNGVNTHKGSIFAFGLVCAAAGYLRQSLRPLTVAEVCHCVARWCDGISDELRHPENLHRPTAGEALYRQYGLTGARGEAEGGFSIVREIALPLLLRGKQDAEHRLLLVLLTLLAINQDTNIAHRGGLDGLHWVQTQAQAALRKAEYWQNPTALKAFLSDFDKACIERRLSAGGSADLLALTWFFARIF